MTEHNTALLHFSQNVEIHSVTEAVVIIVACRGQFSCTTLHFQEEIVVCVCLCVLCICVVQSD